MNCRLINALGTDPYPLLTRVERLRHYRVQAVDVWKFVEGWYDIARTNSGGEP